MKTPGSQGLYCPQFEHDNCGIGAVVDIHGRKSHQTVADALTIVEHLEHRAGKDAEGKTGDGVGILTQVPHKFFCKVCAGLGISIGGEREYGVGMFFLPQNELARRQAQKMFEVIVEKEGLEFLGWRMVPVRPSVLGHRARDCMPVICQGFVKKPEDVPVGLAFDRRLYIVRRVFEQSNEGSYVVSLSSRTIVYKGMFLVGQLRTFFDDLRDEDYESAIAIVHSRFSTNTDPSWERAHPNRFIVHNGEISSYDANRRWVEMYGYKCTLQTDTEALIIEAGVRMPDVKKALKWNISKAVGAVVTHEHNDHAKYIKDFMQNGITVLALYDVFRAKKIDNLSFRKVIEANHGYIIGGFKIFAIPVCHDVPCLGFIIEHEDMGRLLFVTDTMMLEYSVPGLNHILLEANYAYDILDAKIDAGLVPASMKPRLIQSHMEINTTKGILKANDLSGVNEIVLILRRFPAV